jgi:hypothetical protein
MISSTARLMLRGLTMMTLPELLKARQTESDELYTSTHT